MSARSSTSAGLRRKTQLFSELITRCDEAQYSPVASARMSDVYRDGLELISRIESIIKR